MKVEERKRSIQIYLEPEQRQQFKQIAERKGVGEGTLGKIVLNEWLEKQAFDMQMAQA